MLLEYKTWNDMWKNLEHVPSNEFTKEDYLCLTSIILNGLKRSHGEVETHFSFFRSNETVIQKNTGEQHKTNVPRLSICQIRPGVQSPIRGNIAVGLAFCTTPDNPNKYYGKTLAFKRAVIALVARGVSDENVIRSGTRFDNFLKEIQCPRVVKSFLMTENEYANLRTQKEEGDNNGDGKTA